MAFIKVNVETFIEVNVEKKELQKCKGTEEIRNC